MVGVDVYKKYFMIENKRTAVFEATILFEFSIFYPSFLSQKVFPRGLESMK